MKYDERTHEIELSNGRRFYAFDGILSVDENAGRGISYGSDGTVDEDFTAAERAEIADEQIRRWMTWRDSGG